MLIDDIKILLNAHGVCEKLDDFENHGLPDLILFSGGHAIFIFTEFTTNQSHFARKISWQLAPHFIWRYSPELGLSQYDSIVQAIPLNDANDVVSWLDYIEEENKDFDYLAKYSEDS